ncbi:MAG: phospho-N-acetylmuramoyl-pentapeptide-transferase [Alphaproteobacteria bacterium]|nr:phospho-N-acetylmuramoyl-pentapeptide-transferase [Alphaproteobacteria bacterium]
MFHYLASAFDWHFFEFITVRAGGALLTALIMSWVMGMPVIQWLAKKQGKDQPKRDYLPEAHAKKNGTPSMGGVLILLSLTLSVFLFGNLSNSATWIALLTTLGFGGVGCIDDYLKVKKKNSAGLRGKIRLLLEILIATGTVLSIGYFSPIGQETTLVFPFVKEWQFDLGIFYYLFGIFVIVGSANAVNITDGLDGLSTLPSISASFVFLVLAYVMGRIDFTGYLFLPHLPNTAELTVFCGAFLGALLGFLWYNAPPAKVWMGDLGSLALGAGFGTMAVLTKSEFIWAIAGGLFVVEILSVILQVSYFKISGGKRIFKMPPIHHHFELKNWKETTIVLRFWIISIVLALIALATLKMR